MSAETLQKNLKSLGVTPWQLLLGIACIGSWWATVQPLPGKLEQLNSTVQALATRVEVQAVILDSVKELRSEVKTIREELAHIKGRLTVNRSTPKTDDIFGKLEQPNELSSIRENNNQ